MGDEQPQELKVNIEIPFQNKRTAYLVYDVLRIDQEPKRSGVTKTISVEGDKLILNFSAQFARQLRTAVRNFFEKVELVCETLEEFGPAVSDCYSHY